VQQPSGQVASRPLAVLSKHLLGETVWLKALCSLQSMPRASHSDRRLCSKPCFLCQR
jgi:hypothetical protein